MERTVSILTGCRKSWRSSYLRGESQILGDLWLGQRAALHPLCAFSTVPHTCEGQGYPTAGQATSPLFLFLRRGPNPPNSECPLNPWSNPLAELVLQLCPVFHLSHLRGQCTHTVTSAGIKTAGECSAHALLKSYPSPWIRGVPLTPFLDTQAGICMNLVGH